MRLLIRSLAILGGVAALTVYALAQQRGGGIAAKFKQYDKNSDGKVTADEAPAAIMAQFDLNHDGEVTLDEARKAALSAATAPASDTSTESDSALAARLFDAADKDHDGKITREEVSGARWFERLDRDQDGVVLRAEFLAVAKQVREYVEANRGSKDIPTTAAPPQPPPSGPAVRSGTELGVGRQIADVSFHDLDGKTHRLGEVAKGNGVVIAFTSATCPVSKRYAPSLQRLEKELHSQGIAMLLVNPFASEKPEEMKAQGFTALYAPDADKVLARALNARTTTETFVLDATRTLLYRGALDDQYGVNYNRDAPTQRYLIDAVTAMRAGRLPLIAATDAPGCELDMTKPDANTTSVTYHRDVARILQQNCVECHHANGIAPFALDDLNEVKDRAKVIKRVVTQGTMPPWFAAPQPVGKENPWGNDCSLSGKDKTDLLAWIDSADRPLGDATDAPRPLQFPGEWSLGKPDYVVQIPRPVSIKAEGFMPYQVEIAETTLTEDKWVQGYEIVPTDRSVVHHVIVSVHTGKGKIKAAEEGGPTGYWAAYVPGNGGQMYPPGFAKKLPAGARVSFQIHYTPSGKATTDQLKMGLFFAKAPPQFVVNTIGVPKQNLRIPPGDANHVEIATKQVPTDLTVMALMAHMHVRGKAFRFDLKTPDGKSETLLDIPRYDFNWQLRYDYAAPKVVQRGSTLTITAVFDNSAGNKANPDPTKLVRWGQQTFDEMMIGYIEVCTPYQGPATAAR